MIRIALPNKGRLAEPARELMERAGLRFAARGSRALQARLGDRFLAIFVRADDIPEFVADGAADLGVTGRDLVLESGRDLDELLDLEFGRCRLVVATRDEEEAVALSELAADTPVATSFPRLTGEFFAAVGNGVTIVPMSGAAEIAPHIGVADIIVDLVATGSTLKTNGLREIATVLDSSALLIGRPGTLDSDTLGPEARALVDALASVVRARGKRYLMANVPRARLDEVRELLPGISGPTIVDIMDGGDVVAAHAVVDQDATYRVISALRDLGATGILVTQIERLTP